MTDLRVKRTEREIRQAFIELTLEIGFDHITIKTLAEHAVINRQTFYAHYTDKYQLAEVMIRDFVADMNELLEAREKTARQQLNIAESSTTLIPLIERLYVKRNDEVRALRMIVLPNGVSLAGEIKAQLTEVLSYYQPTENSHGFQLELNVAILMTILDHTIEHKELPQLSDVQAALKQMNTVFNG